MHQQFITADIERPIYVSPSLTIEGPRNTLASAEVFQSTLARLLLNSWSAEYALNITPVIQDDSYLKSSLDWTFPQAYYTVLFSARAVLLCNGNPDANEYRITPAMTALSGHGLYKRDFGPLEESPLVHLDVYRISSQNPATIQLPEGQTIREFHQELCSYVYRAQMAHERYVFDCVGHAAYREILAGLRSYLSGADWLSKRSNLLMERSQGNA